MTPDEQLGFYEDTPNPPLCFCVCFQPHPVVPSSCSQQSSGVHVMVGQGAQSGHPECS